MTSAKLSKIYKAISSRCGKCKKKKGTFYHPWWTCKKAKKFLVQIHPMMQKVFQTNKAMKLELFLLDFMDTVLKKKYRKLIL